MSDPNLGDELPETLANDAAEADPSPAEPAESPDDEAQPARQKGIQKRFSQYAQKTRELTQTLESERAELSAAKAELEALRGKATTQNAPVQDDYPDWESFNDAKIIHQSAVAAEKAVKELLASQRADAERHRAEEDREILELTWDEKREAAVTKLPDWNEVIKDVPVPPGSLLERKVLQRKDGPEFVYAVGLYLKEHPNEHAALRRMDDIDALAEMTRMATIAKPPPRRINQPPAPFPKLGGGSATSVPIADMTDKQFAAMRQEQIKARH